ncbi:MAG: hypothetical protein RLY20_1646 [Verrucomicrobiota bacterium]
MTFLPIVERELRGAARKLSVRYIRVAIAGVALIISLIQLIMIPLMMGLGRSSGSAGFGIMTGYAFLLTLLAGVFIAADSLSEEKREGTLGLLFLTDLRGYDVVLGKLAALLLHLGYGLLAIIPAAALPMLFGGVTGEEFWRISLSLVNLLFFCLATGMATSAACRQANVSMALTGVILVIVCYLLPVLQSLLDRFGGGEWTRWSAWLSPASAYNYANAAMSALHPDWFWRALGWSHLGAWMLILFACWRLPHAWQDKPVKERKAGLLERFNLGQGRVQRRRELLAHDPIRWLVGEQWSTRIITWIFAIGWAIGMLAIAIIGQLEMLFIAAVYGLYLLFPIKLLFAAQATRFFVETRRTGAFELLLATPITSQALVSAEWTMLRRIFLPPAILVAASTAAAFLWLLLATDKKDLTLYLGLGVGGVFGGMYLTGWILDFFAMGALGMWLALTMRKPHLATGATILFTLILPSLLCYFSFAVDIILIAVFLSKLRSDFRTIVLEQNRTLAGR